MKKMLVIMLAIAFMFALSGVALAAQPDPPIWIGPGSETYDLTTGQSLWSYQDSRDTTGAKNEGSYKQHEGDVSATYREGDLAGNVTTATAGPTAGYTTNPHGGYDTGGDKCKICHAVHRAEGSYFLLRADSQGDACDYCHEEGSQHSAMIVYTLNTNGKDTPNGHTIGAGSIIPDSSVQQELQDVSVQTIDQFGNPTDKLVKVRAYSSSKNQMFRLARHHGHDPAGVGRRAYKRVGPNALSCMSCHQQHNASAMVWNPPTYESLGTGAVVPSGGYKLLKLSPSGSIWGERLDAATGAVLEDYDIGMQTFKAYTTYPDLVNSSNIVTVPETTMTAANTGNDGVYPNTIYTKFEGEGNDPHQSPQSISQYATSAWCADCHNLNIGYWKEHEGEDAAGNPIELGFRSHADRTHPAPYTGAHDGPSQCYSCHRNDLPTGTSCDNCHYGSGYMAALKADGGKTDFPHSGQDNAIKLLGNYTAVISPTTGTRQVQPASIGPNNTQDVCMRCHTGVGTNH